MTIIHIKSLMVQNPCFCKDFEALLDHDIANVVEYLYCDDNCKKQEK